MTDDTMTPDALRAAIEEIKGPNGQRAMSRHLAAEGVIADRDGSRLRKMLQGKRPIPPEVATAVAELLAAKRKVRTGMTKLEQLFARVRARHPRASMVYAQIILMLQHGPAYQRDLCASLDDDANSSTVSQAILRLEDMGIVQVDRGPSSQAGYTVSIADGFAQSIRNSEKSKKP